MCLNPLAFNHCGITPLDSESAEVFEDDFMKNTETFKLYFNFISSITESKRYPNFFEHRLLFNYETTLLLSQFMRTRDEGDFGAKYKNAITANKSSRYAMLTSLNSTYFP